jgi:hypothetical protein
MMSERPKLGDWCKFKAEAGKFHEGAKTQWERCELGQVQRGMYIGWRTVFNGQMENVYEYGDWENPQAVLLGRYFFQSEPLEVWLFVTNERQNFMRVFPDDVLSEETA